MLWLRIILFLVRLGSERQIKFRLSTEEFKKNLNLLKVSCSETIAHHDTLENLLKKLKPDEISMIRYKMIARMIRIKCLKAFRLLGKYYMVAVDSTGHLVFKERHCPHCLTKKKMAR